MIAIDTNVLIRLLVEDDEIQSQKSLKLIKQTKMAFISAPVILETIWVLESCYELNKENVIAAVEKILRITQFHIEHSEAIWHALREYKQVNTDLSDCIIGAIAQAHDCSTVVTFDKKAARSKFFELIK